MDTLKTPNVPEDILVPVKIKLASLWTSLMFLYIYVDYLHLYMPDTLQNMLNGIVFEFTISQVFLLIALVSVSIPALMIYLSVVLPAKLNRRVNIIMGTIYIPYTLFNLVGEAWLHMFYGAIVEVILLCFIIRYAWKWQHVIEYKI
jgi:hypothetical protein